MAQRKKIFFLGRRDADTGYDFFGKMIKRKALDTVEDSESADYVFVGGYLSALESFLKKKIVLASFDNPIKQDYWLMHPMASEIGFNGKIPNSFSQKAFDWAKNQTWDKLANQYEELWRR